MAGDVAERGPKGPKKGLRRPKRRVSIRIDMTPMVDIAFLLLIFYMVSTVFAMPQAMEINLPPKEEEETQIEIAESNLLTLRVDSESRYWWNLKNPTPENLPKLIPSDTPGVYVFNSDSLRGLLKAQNEANAKLNTLVLIHEDATYADLINILDEIDVLERGWNAYTAKQLNVEIKDLPRERKFSYRYAVGDWEERDDRIMLEAQAAAAAMGNLQP